MATSEVVNLRGIVLRVSPTKETGAMVNAIGENGFFSFYAHGAKKLASPNAGSLQPFVEADFLLARSSSDKYTLKESSRGIALVDVDSSMESMLCAALIAEITLKLVQSEDASSVYPWLKGALDALYNKKDALTATLIYFAHVLGILGYGLDVNECVSCGSKENIKAISYEEGGFLCGSCALELGVQESPLVQLKILRYAFKAPLSDYGRVTLDRLPAKAVLADLSHYVDSITGVKLNSTEFILSV